MTKESIFHNIKILFLFAWTVLFMPSCHAQRTLEKSANRDNFIDIQNGISLDADGLSNIYVVANNNHINKYGSGGQLIYSYTNDRLGSLSNFDSNNPMKLLVFSSDYQLVISFDNTLSETARYDLSELGFDDILCVGASNDNNIWIYDSNAFSLKKIDRNGKEFITSSSLIYEGLEDLSPTQIEEHSNFVFVLDPKIGIILFDNLGQFIKTISIKNIRSFQALANRDLLLLRNNKIEVLYWEALASELLFEKENIDILDFCYDEQLYILTNTGVQKVEN